MQGQGRAAAGDSLGKRLREDEIQIPRGREDLVRPFPGLEETEFKEALRGVVGLWRIGPADQREQGIPSLIRCQADTDLKVRFHVAPVLGSVGYAALDEENNEVRRHLQRR